LNEVIEQTADHERVAKSVYPMLQVLQKGREDARDWARRGDVMIDTKEVEREVVRLFVREEIGFEVADISFGNSQMEIRARPSAELALERLVAISTQGGLLREQAHAAREAIELSISRATKVPSEIIPIPVVNEFVGDLIESAADYVAERLTSSLQIEKVIELSNDLIDRIGRLSETKLKGIAEAAFGVGSCLNSETSQRSVAESLRTKFDSADEDHVIARPRNQTGGHFVLSKTKGPAKLRD
jgi:hypothetical protein